MKKLVKILIKYFFFYYNIYILSKFFFIKIKFWKHIVIFGRYYYPIMIPKIGYFITKEDYKITWEILKRVTLIKPYQFFKEVYINNKFKTNNFVSGIHFPAINRLYKKNRLATCKQIYKKNEK